MYDKATIFNLALNALLLNYQTVNPDTDNALPIKTLRLMYPIALSKTLSDLDLDKTSQVVILEKLPLAEHPHWQFVYKYPANCAKFRRIISCVNKDNRETRIPTATGLLGAQDVIYVNEDEAEAEIIATDTPLSVLNPSAGLALANQLAMLCSSLVVGKGANELKKMLSTQYIMHKADAQEDDINENVDTTPDEFESEFVTARLGGNQWRSRT